MTHTDNPHGARRALGGQASSPAPFGWRFTTPVLLGSALNPVNSSLIATALVPIGRAFGVPVARTGVLVAALYLASAVAQPACGKLAEHFGARRVFLAGIVIVLAAGILGTTAHSFTTVLAARVLIGIGTSAGYPTAMLLIRNRTQAAGLDAPPSGVLTALSVTGQATAAAGLPLGGLLVGLAGWRAAFLVNIPLALATLAFAAAFIPPDQPSTHTGQHRWRRLAADIDLIGMALFTAAVLALLVFLLALPHLNPAALAGALAACGALTYRELRARTPFLDLRALATHPALTRTYLRSGATFLIIYTVLYGVTQWLQSGPGLSATAAGLAMLPATALAVLVSIPSGRHSLVRTPLLAAAGCALAGAAVLATAPATTGIVITAVLFFGPTIGLGSVANQAALYAQAPPETLGTASGLLRTFNYLGAIGSTALLNTAFRHGATDTALHTTALFLFAMCAIVLTATVLDRALPRQQPPPLPLAPKVHP